MKTQKFGSPRVEFSWLLQQDDYSRSHGKITLDTAEGESQLVKAIKLCIDQGYELRIGTDGVCLIMEANYAEDEFSDASYQYVDDDHDVIKKVHLPDGSYEDVYSDEEERTLITSYIREHTDWDYDPIDGWQHMIVEEEKSEEDN